MAKTGKKMPWGSKDYPIYRGPAFEAVDCDDADPVTGNIALREL